MRLLQLSEDGRFSLEWFSKDSIPPYAILSHTWGRGKDDEVTFKDISEGTGDKKPGFQKLLFCGKQAKADNLHYFWVDSACIDKSNNNELTTAINSMFRWYKNAVKCYVYLSDVVGRTWETDIQKSLWFTRGWTLQELLAPEIVVFYARDGILIGDKCSLEQQIAEVSGIPLEALRGHALSEFDVHERMSWAKGRQTTEEEDMAYSLLGIFEIHMPLIYGEGAKNAYKRLHEEIDKSRHHLQDCKYWRVAVLNNL
jgi:hypothetical protein